MNAASLNVAELYVAAFQQLARTNNTLILPANCNDVTSMVSQAMATYQTLAKTQGGLQPTVETAESKSNEDPVAEYFSDEDDRPTSR